MADELVRALNKLGYLPVFLPRTKVEPPELYNYARTNQRLIRRGALSAHVPKAKDLKNFITWALTHGQAPIRKLVFAPMPLVVIRAANRTLAKVHS